MDTMVAPDVRAWLPAPWRAFPAHVACPVCGALGELVYSVAHTYLCCVACGWQRRLTHHADRVNAALVVSAPVGLPWPTGFLVDLAAQAPDALPPVPALLWRQTSDHTWDGPSRTRAGRRYQVRRHTSGHVTCGCPHYGVGCWHVARARELGLVAPDPAELLERKAAAEAAALADLWDL